MTRWTDKYEVLKQYAECRGNALVHRSYVTEDGCKLGSWVSRQRKLHRKRKLPAQRVRALERVLGWSWSPIEDAWWAARERLDDFVTVEGHAFVPRGYVTRDGFRLGSWVRNQRKNSTLPDDRRGALQRIPGWTWRASESAWDECYRVLCEFVDREGHAHVPRNYRTPSGRKLGHWTAGQRDRYRKGTLPLARQRELEMVRGWSWNPRKPGSAPRDEHWQACLSRLREYVEREGHALVPAKYVTPDGFKLGDWVCNQRQFYRRKILSKSRQWKLRQVRGWTWHALLAEASGR